MSNQALLYIHIPYCVVKCPYCEFNSYSISSTNAKHSFDEARYTEALCKELTAYCEKQPWPDFAIRSVFFGGGTPSLFSAQSIAKIIDTANKLLRFERDVEVTLEANPGTIQEPVDLEKIKGYKLAGINRISLGAQSFLPEKLNKLGRIHKVEDIKNAVDNVLASGINNFNIDHIFGVLGDTLDSWSTEMNAAFALEPKHISAYCLTLEPGTPFFKQALVGNSMAVDEELSAALFEATMQRFAEAGYRQYELSNYALPGQECRHNSGYWEGKAYLGLGAGAHSFLSATAETPFGSRWSNTPSPLRYMDLIERQDHAQQSSEVLSAKEVHNEYFYLRLRTDIGISQADYRSATGADFSRKTHESIEFLIAEGLLNKKASHFILSPKGKLLVNSILEEFVL